MVDWILNNRQWVFSGIGVAVLVGVVGWLRSRGKAGLVQKQRSGSNSANLQAGGNISIGGGGGKHGRK